MYGTTCRVDTGNRIFSLALLLEASWMRTSFAAGHAWWWQANFPISPVVDDHPSDPLVPEINRRWLSWQIPRFACSFYTVLTCPKPMNAVGFVIVVFKSSWCIKKISLSQDPPFPIPSLDEIICIVLAPPYPCA